MVNKDHVRLNIYRAALHGIKNHFKSAKVRDELPDIGVVLIDVLGLTFEVQVRLIDKPVDDKSNI
jgi:hypothetical protein